MTSNSELRKQYQNEEKEKSDEYYQKEKDKEREVSKLQINNKYKLIQSNIQNKAKEEEIKNKNKDEIKTDQLENKYLLDSEKINNKYDEEFKKLEIKEEKDKLQHEIDLKKIEKDKIFKELDTKEKIMKMNNINDEDLKLKEIDHIKKTADSNLTSLKTILNSQEIFEKRKNELDLERIGQNNKYEEEDKKITNEGDIKIRQIELDKELKLKEQENEKQRKDMILDIFDQIFQAKQASNNQNQN